ncbi:MAG: tetratricopeptide repeat protein [Deltaproteobacteria bacterium]|nr:tetratricopeptide repeat protein [Deltaproteobacteria bacterium]
MRLPLVLCFVATVCIAAASSPPAAAAELSLPPFSDETGRAKALLAWVPTLKKAARAKDTEVLGQVFAEPLAASGLSMTGDRVLELAKLVKDVTRGRASSSCRGAVCELSFQRGMTRTELLLTDRGGAWAVWDPRAHGDALPVQVTASLEVRGPGTLRALVNGVHTYLLDDVRDTSTAISMLDRALVLGSNRLTLVPLDLPAGESLTVSLRVGGWPRTEPYVDTLRDDLLRWDGTVSEPVEITFVIPDEDPVERELTALRADMEKAHDAGDPSEIGYAELYGDALCAAGRPDEGRAAYERSIARQQAVHGVTQHLQIAVSRMDLAECLAGAGAGDSALLVAKESLAEYEAVMPVDDGRVLLGYIKAVLLAESLGSDSERRAWRAEVERRLEEVPEDRRALFDSMLTP